MKDKDLGRLYCHRDFMKFLKKKSVDHEITISEFTRQAAKNPNLLIDEPPEKKKTRKSSKYYEPFF